MLTGNMLTGHMLKGQLYSSLFVKKNDSIEKIKKNVTIDHWTNAHTTK